MRRHASRVLPVLALLICQGGPAAAHGGTFGIRDGPTLAERLKDLGLVYRRAENPIVQEVWILGRYHGQYHWTDATTGGDDAYEDRRFRLGVQARLFGNLTIHAQAISGSDFEPAYNGFTELWVGWQFGRGVLLTVGQQKHRFTYDRNVSSRYLQTLERSLLTNMFNADYTPGVTLSGQAFGWNYYGGVFSDRTDRAVGDVMFDWDSGTSLLATATRDVGRWFDTDTAHLNVSFFHSDAAAGATNLNRFDDGFAAALILTDGPGSVITEATVGLGAAAGNAYGITVQPGYFLTRKLQLVGRYQFAFSNGEQGLTAQRRYEQAAGLTTGDFYQAAYVGWNYYLAEHRLKLMTGLEYSALGGESAWTGSVALRMFWGPQSRGPFPMAQVLGPD